MNFGNMGGVMQMMGLWNRFKNNHPKFPAFLTAVMQNGIQEGTILEINVTTPEGKLISSNLKVTADDMQILQELKDTVPRQ